MRSEATKYNICHCILQKNEISCLNLSDNRNVSHYIACESYGGQNIRDTEIGINALVAQEIGNVSKNKPYYNSFFHLLLLLQYCVSQLLPRALVLFRFE